MNNNCEDCSFERAEPTAASGSLLDSALDELGLLSSVTSSRRQYLQEKEQFLGRLGALTMDDEESYVQAVTGVQQHRHQRSQQQQEDTNKYHHHSNNVFLSQTLPNNLFSNQRNTNNIFSTPQSSSELIQNVSLSNDSPIVSLPARSRIQSEPSQLVMNSLQSQSFIPCFETFSFGHQPSQSQTSFTQISQSTKKDGVLGTKSHTYDSKIDDPDSLLNKSIAKLTNLQTLGSPSNCTFNAPFPFDRKDSKNSLGTEKENDNLSGFEVLTMNTNFITSFKTDYKLPSHVDGASNKYSFSVLNASADNYLHKNNTKRNPFRRKRMRSHPYENCNGTYPTLLHMYSSSSASRSKVSSNGDNYRLRTTSLSNGSCLEVCAKKRFLRVAERCNGGVVRSRSMEDLSAAGGNNVSADNPLWDDTAEAIVKTKEVENVSRAIQQMCVQDTR